MATGSLLFVVSTEGQGLLVQVRLNDVTVYVNRTGTQSAFSEKVNPLMLSGQNTVTVALGLPAAAPESKKAAPPEPGGFPPPPPDPPAFTLKLQQGRQGTDPGDAGILAQFEWEAGQAPVATGSLTEVFRRTVQLGSLPWRPRWFDVRPTQLDARALNTLVRGYVEALRKRDVETLVALSTLRFEELGRSLEMSPERMAQSFRAYLQGMMSAADWSVLPAGTAEWSYAPEGNGRLVRITMENGDPPITVVANGRPTPFDLTVAWIDGHWRIVR